ncbi:protein FAM228A [Chaetodon auriga]|uniref:protein FAM228A n=1 Tax=Chaetodon auriga TaxID=39042 RepID=UPI004032D6E1
MSPKKTDIASGAITFNTPLPVSLLKSEECTADAKDATESRKSPPQLSVRVRSTGTCAGAGPSEPQLRTKQGWLCHTSLRQLQAKMEAENQQVKEIIQPLLDTENGLVKDLEKFLSQQDVAELRRRELQHKRWTERVWFPLQRRVEEHVSSCSPMEAKRRQSLYSHYLHHCNTKGSVFLETYDLREYNPFLLNIKRPHCLKLTTADLKGPLYLQLHERLKENRTDRSCEAGCKYKLPQSNPPLGEFVASQADVLLQASSNYPVSAYGKIRAKGETERRQSGRLHTIPHHIWATATPDGRCHQSGCWVSRYRGWQQPASLHQSLPKSK